MKHYHEHRKLNIDVGNISSERFAELAEAAITDITDELDESCSACVLEDDEIVYITGIQPPHIQTTAHTVGTRLPAFATATGRVLLAALPTAAIDNFFHNNKLTALTRYTTTDEQELRIILSDTSEKGWSYVHQEREEGISSIAVPIADKTGAIVASLAIHGPSHRLDEETMVKMLLPQLQKAARKITAELPNT